MNTKNYFIDTSPFAISILKIEGDKRILLDVNKLELSKFLKSAVITANAVLEAFNNTSDILKIGKHHPVMTSLYESLSELPEQIALELMNPLNADKIELLDADGELIEIKRQ